MSTTEDKLINNWKSDRGFNLSQPSSPTWESSVESAGGVYEALSGPVHNMLMTAGYIDGIGSIADIADAVLYAAEGEFGESVVSLSSALPVAGSIIAGKKILKNASKNGERMVTIHRGYGDWHKGNMVKDGLFVGGKIKSTRMGREGMFSPLYTTESLDDAKTYAKSFNKQLKLDGIANAKPKVLTFEVPESWLKKNTVFPDGKPIDFNKVDQFGKHESLYPVDIFKQGLPREFLTKVTEL